ncbi:cytochrome P450 26A1-like [Elysia marginata]|uniref:Cytochrome P450 26A1-like n=1 Tax=Elysia marginata TaxID=1093978 RepID=A0AAV4J1P4_9GAST|nr:cytochrome P450 26A1-like [Elysia marginata]
MLARKRLIDEIGASLKGKARKDAMARESNEPGGSLLFQDAMSRLLDVQGEDSLSDSELKDLCLELLFAGHATTASAATSLLLQLHKHRKVLSKIQSELEDLDLDQDVEGDLTMASLSRLEYIAAVVKEVLRLSPPVGGAYRTVLKSFTLKGYHIPAGWTLGYSIRDTQHMSNLFPNVDTFDPDRWLGNSSSREDKFDYLPFGGGTRSCVGKEFAKLFLKVFIVEVVRSCSWNLINNNVTMSYLPVPHPVDGLPLRFSASSSASKDHQVASDV